MTINFSDEDIEDIVFWRDHNNWTFEQIAAYKGVSGHASEIQRVYEIHSEEFAVRSQFNRKEFVKNRIWSMFHAANQRRGIPMTKEVKDQLKPVVRDMIDPLCERKDLDLCLDLWNDNGRTTWCKPSLDHIIPVSCGGTDDLGNLQWLPRFMNVWKLAESQSDWKIFCKQAPKFFIDLSKFYDSQKGWSY